MSTITIYHNPKCGTSRNVLALIRNAGIEPTVIEYLKTPPSRAELVALIAATGAPVRELIRAKEPIYAELNLADPALSDDALIDAMLAHPILINRPLVVSPLGTRLCRPSEAVLDLLPAFEVRRLLERLGCEVRIFDPKGLPLPDEAPASHPKVHELRDLSQWSEGQVWVSPERHGAMTGIMKSQIDWIPLSVGSVRPTQGKTLAVMEVSGGSQSFNAVNQMRILGRWMRMVTIPNQSSVAKAYQEFDADGRMKPSSYYDRVVDVCEELVKFTILTRDASAYLTDRYSERKEQAAELEKRVSLRSI
jgi:arsenic resistance protein ArsH